MKKGVVALLALALGVTAAAIPALAHHSFSAEFDANKPTTMQGFVTKIEWTNPHVWFYVDVKEEDGKITTWGFSGAPPGSLMRRGITKEALKIGAVVHVEGSRARDGSNNASSHTVTFTDGKNVLTATSEAGR